MRRAPARGWSPEESASFEAALSLHGRDWKAVAAHVRTRDARAVANHAQKWFVRLAMKGERVPTKVAEQGGEGYTLSGKPLDATSATARAYGLKVGVIRRYLAEGREMPGMLLPLPEAEEGEEGETEKALAAAAAAAAAGKEVEKKKEAEEKLRAASASEAKTNDENDSGDEGAALADKRGGATTAATAGGETTATATTAAASAAPAAAASGEAPTPSALHIVSPAAPAAPAAVPAPAAPAVAAKEKEEEKEAKQEAAAKEEQVEEEEKPSLPPPPPSEAPFFVPPPPSPPRQRTEYALSRPRRAAPQRSAAAAALRLGATSESLELLACREFSEFLEPGCGLPLAQPYALRVSREALAVMDLHAHLHHEEIIGLLGGKWERSKATVTVTRAFPCARASGTGSRTSVELDAAAEVTARAAMADAGLVPVGWYHSHPIFAPTPSRKDAENQRNYQALFRISQEEEEEEEEEREEEEGNGGEKNDGGGGDGGCCGGGKAPPRLSKSSTNSSSSNNNVEPFVGAIVGPYDQALPSPAAVTSWFCVAAASAASATGGVGAGSVGGGSAAELAPFSLRCKVGERAAVTTSSDPSDAPSSDSSHHLRETLLQVARASKLETDAVDLSQRWRSFSFVSGGAPLGEALTKGAKARLSLARHLADGAASERLLDEVCAELGVVVGGGGGEEKKKKEEEVE